MDDNTVMQSDLRSMDLDDMTAMLKTMGQGLSCQTALWLGA